MSDIKFKAIRSHELRAELERAQPGCTGAIEIHPPANELMEIAFSSIKPKPIQWLWHKRIARGKVTIFAGEPGKGKSQLLLWIAAACSNGSQMPVDAAYFPLGKVAILSAEDDEDDTLSPRLYALGANQDLVLQLKATPRIDEKGKLTDGTVRLDEDIQRLDNTLLNKPGYVCLIIDPITAYLGDINDHKNSEVRTLISKITALAKKHNIAVILNTHLSKPGNGAATTSAMNRVIGSIAYVAAARAAYLICDNEDDRTIKQFLPMKNNVGDDLTGFEYRIKVVKIQDEIETTHIEWLKTSIVKDANEALNKTKSSPQKQIAIDFLKDCLKNGAMLLTDIRRRAEEADISPPILYKAKDELKIIQDEITDRYCRKIWMLPPIS